MTFEFSFGHAPTDMHVELTRRRAFTDSLAYFNDGVALERSDRVEIEEQDGGVVTRRFCAGVFFVADGFASLFLAPALAVESVDGLAPPFPTESKPVEVLLVLSPDLPFRYRESFLRFEPRSRSSEGDRFPGVKSVLPMMIVATIGDFCRSRCTTSRTSLALSFLMIG